jgi:hypothetical protein
MICKSVRARLELSLSLSPRKGVYSLIVPNFHDCLCLLVLAGMHPVYLVKSVISKGSAANYIGKTR